MQATVKHELEEINSNYREIEDYIDPPPHLIASFTDDDWVNFAARSESSRSQYEKDLKQLNVLLPTLGSATIAEAYNQGCRLMQRNLSGYMAQHFDPVYVPVMVKAIETKHFHTAQTFLQVLADHEYPQIENLLSEAIKLRELQDVALSIIRQLRLKSFQDIVNDLCQSPDKTINEIANNTKEILLQE